MGKVWSYKTDEGEALIFEPENRDIVAGQKIIDEEVAPILRKIAQEVERAYKEACKTHGKDYSFEEFYKKRCEDRGIPEMLARAERIGLVDVTEKYKQNKA